MVSTCNTVDTCNACAEVSCIISPAKMPAGIDAARFASLPADKQRKLRALAASIDYVTRLQAKAGGSIDGIDLPCVQESRKGR
ncbi:hypothetical protein GUITHDRAFT_119323 [Guillardia theta CCMP2712]|uniref:Uncharacterized protein n=1 Tax=Guillardia theta (strain CCMP2712) TaxID=905079 RepID=L1IEG5_GUITC|nr:hypothetical protein GUITHDRAFT_119323 [Guillardia theta CCMP2712]EKX34487.1 hypothetical protein GUITHDRAFT_119323 [Guillardia theta CCMP2712]|eukprot:XP_005821467.1 hypothetical protein GUITHDRAFT_119323 [Guillardia theta CCMP2712]